MSDAQERYRKGQLRPGEDFRPDANGQVSINGQVSVMMVNGLIAKDIFDANPGHEFFVEESFPLDWMYPHETPYGIIMKVNRAPVKEFTQEIVDQDHKFWTEYSKRLIGDWITYDTPITNITAFAERLYLRRDLRGFKGDPKFIRDDDAQKNFSKLRSAQGALYSWRVSHVLPGPERDRALKEAMFAFKQSFAFCPYSAEVVGHLITLIMAQGHLDDALAIAKTCLKLDPGNGQIASVVRDLERFKANPQASRLTSSLAEATDRLAKGDTNSAFMMLDSVIADPNADAALVLKAAETYAQMGAISKMEPAMNRLVVLAPANPEAWYDLAKVQAILRETDKSLTSLETCIKLSRQRLAREPASKDLAHEASVDPFFAPLKALPRFQQAIAPK
jgi:tetratricopeptide (TPR) repeat protein